MNNNAKIVGLVVVGLTLLPGCMGVRNYQPRPLREVKSNVLQSKTSQAGITLRIKQLTSQEKSYCFDGHILPLDGIKAIYLSISNVSGKPYSISPDGINVPQISLRDIKKSVRKTDTFAYFSGAVAAGSIIAIPVALAFWYVAWAPAFIAAMVALPFEGMFLAKGGRSAVMNHRIDKDLREKILHKKIVIKPGDHCERLIFVKSLDYNPNFTVTIQGKNKSINPVVFDVDLAQ